MNSSLMGTAGAPRTLAGKSPRNILTIDLEDWHQGLEIDMARWSSFEDRVERSTRRLLDILEEAEVSGTFFVLGYVAERHPDLIRAIVNRGHEIATHGYSHAFIYDQSPAQFREELRTSIDLLEQITGCKVQGHRAAFFSITKDSLWALDILAEHELVYDSSIFPVSNYRYGIPTASRTPAILRCAGGTILELPPSTLPVCGKNAPVGGGAYFRIYPYVLTRAAFRWLNARNQRIIFYIHPWELDAAQPRIPLPKRIARTHYYGLRSTEGKLRKLLRDFSFGSVKDALKETWDLQPKTWCEMGLPPAPLGASL